MAAKMEILKDGVWFELELKSSKEVKYNARINKIGETSNRQIGSTNTFTLPPTAKNIQALGINIFNQYTLAKALNRKYIANYFISNKLVQNGFILINNTRGGEIHVNFIDEALDVVSKWGSITYKELLEDEILPVASDYQTAISELRNYDMPVNTLLAHLPPLGSRGYNLCLFPNNLNPLGDAFQKNENGIRLDDSFNPYQSRPIFNAMSLFDLACERFGYTGIFDASVDWDTIKETYFIAQENDKNDESDDSTFQNDTYDPISSTTYFADKTTVGLLTRRSQVMMKFPTSNSIQPNDFGNWADNSYVYDPAAGFWTYKSTSFWRDSNTVFTPNLQNGNGGEITFTGDVFENDASELSLRVIAYWAPTNPAANVISEAWGTGVGANPFPTEIVRGTDHEIDITIDKNLFNSVPTGASHPIGITVTGEGFLDNGLWLNLYNMQVSEVSLTGDTVSFDDFDQFENTTVDFTYAASRKTLKTLMTSIMHKEGILMNIDSSNKEIKFFTYGHYVTQMENDAFEVWDDYLLKYNKPEWQTNYGNNYAKLNEISLSEPFKGNAYSYELENQGELSRYQDRAQDKLANFKDVSQVFDVNNTLNPYTEYTSKGLGLVEFRGTVSGSLDQVRADIGTSPGNILLLPLIANVNYATIPNGVKEWYDLVDSAVRVKSNFLLPVDVIKKLDLSKPIYVGRLGGFYIIEEISEYTNPETPVTVKLIKLITELGIAP